MSVSGRLLSAHFASQFWRRTTQNAVKGTCGRPHLSDPDLLGQLSKFTQYTEQLGKLLRGNTLEPSVQGRQCPLSNGFSQGYPFLPVFPAS
jgi:hypothetical protein